MHERFPDVTFDCTVKVEHVPRGTPTSGRSSPTPGCLFVVSAFESVERRDARARLDKGHTAADAAERRRAPARRGHRRAAVVPAVHAVDHPRRRRRVARLRRTSTTWSAASTRCSTRPAAPPAGFAAARLIPTSSPHLGPWDDGTARRTRGGRRPGGRRAAAARSRRSWSDARTATPATATYAAVRAAAGAPPVDLTQRHRRTPAPQRELVLLRRAHRAPVAAVRRHRGVVPKSLLAPVQAHALAPVLAPVQARAPEQRCACGGATERRWMSHGSRMVGSCPPLSSTSAWRPRSRDALRNHAAESGVSLNAFAVQALAAAAGPEFLRDVRAGGTPSSVGDERRVLERPAADRDAPDRHAVRRATGSTGWAGRRRRGSSKAARTTTGYGPGTSAASGSWPRWPGSVPPEDVEGGAGAEPRDVLVGHRVRRRRSRRWCRRRGAARTVTGRARREVGEPDDVDGVVDRARARSRRGWRT